MTQYQKEYGSVHHPLNVNSTRLDSPRNLECLNLLLNTGADFNRKDSFGRFVAFNPGCSSRLCSPSVLVKCLRFQDPSALRCCQL